MFAQYYGKADVAKLLNEVAIAARIIKAEIRQIVKAGG